MMQPKARNNRFRRWIERVLLLAGVVGVGVWVASNVIPLVWQDWGDWVFDSELRGDTATVGRYLAARTDLIMHDVEAWLGFTPTAKLSIPRVASPRMQRPPIGENTLIGRITIPRLHLSAIVREGVGQDTLGLAVGHVPGTALPGQSGNVGVAGHRDTLFLGLKGIRANDVIQFETLKGNYLYQVKSTEIVKPRDVGVLSASQYPELTLVTCYPFRFIGPAPDRFIVKAREVFQNPLQKSLLERDAKVSRQIPDAPPEEAGVPARTKRIQFEVERTHSRTLAPGISIGIDDTDVIGQQVKGWMWIMPDRRTIWLKGQNAGEPKVFYGHEDGKKRELMITNVTRDSVSGYLLLPGQFGANRQIASTRPSN